MTLSEEGFASRTGTLTHMGTYQRYSWKLNIKESTRAKNNSSPTHVLHKNKANKLQQDIDSHFGTWFLFLKNGCAPDY